MSTRTCDKVQNHTFQISHCLVVHGSQETFLIPRMYQVDLYICLLHRTLVKTEASTHHQYVTSHAVHFSPNNHTCVTEFCAHHTTPLNVSIYVPSPPWRVSRVWISSRLSRIRLFGRAIWFKSLAVIHLRPLPCIHVAPIPITSEIDYIVRGVWGIGNQIISPFG